jgi:histidinol phosphatase-like PHP family hydrolase
LKIYSEPCYDIDELTNYNLHVHTIYSRCAKREMTATAIIREAERCGVKMLALTDHFADEGLDILAQDAALRREVEETGTGIRVLYGAELSGCGIGKYTDTDEQNAGLDYRLYACNHFHVDCWDRAEDQSPRGWAVFAMDIVDSIIRSGRADAIAHPLIGRFLEFEDKHVVTNAITDNELGDLLTTARDHGVAWEINRGAALGFPEFAARYWNIGREVGVTFHFGGDSHAIDSVDPKKQLDELKKIFI